MLCLPVSTFQLTLVTYEPFPCGFLLVFHPVECSYCRSESMMGFRYRCQQCHGYQLCQSCFWRGHANGPHSNQHQMKEHSSWVGTATTKSLSQLVIKIPPVLFSSHSSELVGKRMDRWNQYGGNSLLDWLSAAQFFQVSTMKERRQRGDRPLRKRPHPTITLIHTKDKLW